MKKILVAIAGVSIFAGLPLLIWLPAGCSAFIAHPARFAYAILAGLIQIGVAAWVPGQGFSQPEGKTVVVRQRIAVLLLQLLTIGIVVVSPWTDRNAVLPLWSPLRYVGLGFFVAGSFLMNWAIVWLGRHFSVQVTLQENHRLVTEGPYKLIRHPRYAGIACCFLGVALVFASAAGLLLSVLLFATLLWRIHDEETLMAAAFPVEWPAYKLRSAKLIPFIL